ncbi:hypothetical protein BCF55_0393 [Hydrogenivirga caldilitoris]|uniref:Uncharacterized protein n=1 Tax=Hydrogenivirga caldilitoris TaxID=246264 RepID=A0A497XPT6_9AQUI|nr:hypothetical protein [Hydrogenivirga caldilitoris]RLJ70129.1 hypothetical protein BCF55_0393 [Hydrogenivirga caldilitoris]
MKLTKYKLMLFLPVPLSAIAGYYLAGILALFMEASITPRTDKDFAQLPDFQLMKVDFDPEVANLLSYIKVKRIKEEKIPQTVEAQAEQPPQYTLSFTYVGEKKKYAIINDTLVKEGDMLSMEERVVKITREGVLLSGKWGKRWLRVSE